MEKFLYLIAIALIEKDGKRSMPLGGKSIKDSEDLNLILDQKGKPIALELLLRLFQQSDKNSIRRISTDNSLLISLIPMDLMQNKIPSLKSDWLKTGNNEKFISELNLMCEGLWEITFSKHQGIVFSRK